MIKCGELSIGGEEGRGFKYSILHTYSNSCCISYFLLYRLFFVLFVTNSFLLPASCFLRPTLFDATNEALQPLVKKGEEGNETKAVRGAKNNHKAQGTGQGTGQDASSYIAKPHKSPSPSPSQSQIQKPKATRPKVIVFHSQFLLSQKRPRVAQLLGCPGSESIEIFALLLMRGDGIILYFIHQLFPSFRLLFSSVPPFITYHLLLILS